MYLFTYKSFTDVYFFLWGILLLCQSILLLSCLNLNLKKNNDKKMFETQRKKITVKCSRLESVLILKQAFLLRFPQFAWLDGAGLIVYWGAWCWSGTDLPTKCKSPLLHSPFEGMYKWTISMKSRVHSKHWSVWSRKEYPWFFTK